MSSNLTIFSWLAELVQKIGGPGSGSPGSAQKDSPPRKSRVAGGAGVESASVTEFISPREMHWGRECAFESLRRGLSGVADRLASVRLAKGSMSVGVGSLASRTGLALADTRPARSDYTRRLLGVDANAEGKGDGGNHPAVLGVDQVSGGARGLA
jgi:hypothetical protein